MYDHDDSFDKLASWPSLTWTDTGKFTPWVSHITCPQINWTESEAAIQPNSDALAGRGRKGPAGAAFNPEGWLVVPKPNPQASMRLFCFPYAGGGATTYRGWLDNLPEHVEVGLILLPGRENRLVEPPFKKVTPVVLALAQVLRPHLFKKFAFFGHSMGAIICFELTRQLRRLRLNSPTHLFVSARGAPQIADRSAPTHNLPEPQLLDELRRLNGTPREVLDNPELLRLILPTLRADFEVVQTYNYMTETPLDCPITAFDGMQDQDITVENLEAWREQTRMSFSLHMLPGDHFFINTQRTLLLEKLSRELTQLALAAD